MKLSIVSLLLFVNTLIAKVNNYEKFLSTFVYVNGKERAIHFLYTDNTIVGFFIESKDWTDKEIRGYGGPINLQIYFSLDGKIQKIKVIEQYETKIYTKDVFTEKFFSQYYNKDDYSKFSLGEDIHGITGATITCSAVNEILYQCVKNVKLYLKSKNEMNIVSFRMSKIEIFKICIALLLFTTSVVGFVKNIHMLRNIVLLVSIVFLGIVYKGGISIGHIQSLLNLNLIVTGNIFILILLGLILLTTLIFGRLFCGWLCPFGAVIEFIFNIKKFFEIKYKKSLGKEIEVEFVEDSNIVKFLRRFEFIYVKLKYILAALIIIIPTIIVVEPFQYLFLIHKTTLTQLIYLLVILLLNILFIRLWCRYLCPLGGVLGLVSKISVFKLNISTQLCLRCEICKSICPTNAIVEKNNSLKIIHTECILCNKCRSECGPKSVSLKNTLIRTK
ncbi:MAG: 4Fe-4S binding protein [Endomicrobia bacterium]|nr:4Fe-4S binding protein [Endomicrobiia bacterium]